MSQQYDYPLPPAKKGIFSSLSVPNYRLYVIGHFISMIGAWMQIVALSWLVWELTKSGDWLGWIGFVGRFPILILGLIGGAVADKFFRRNLILITQSLLMFQASILAILTITEIISPELIMVLVIFSGFIYAFDFPARQSFITDMVGKGEVDNAVALSASIVHAARVIGPAIAGIIVAYLGESACFIINALTFTALIVAILLMDRSKLFVQPTHNLPMHKAIVEGIKTAWDNPRLRKPLILVAVISMFGMPYYVLVPMFVDKVYHQGAELYGFLMAISAGGALIGSAVVAKMTGKAHLKRNMCVAAVGFSVSILTFAWMHELWVGMIVMLFIGFFALINLASINAWLQKEAEDIIRGRIMSLFTIMFFGTVPIGALFVGMLAERIGPQTTLTISGSVCLILSIWFLISAYLKPRAPSS